MAITQLNTKAGQQTTAGANNNLTPTQQDKLEKVIKDFLKEEGLEADLWVGGRKIVVILPEPQ